MRVRLYLHEMWWWRYRESTFSRANDKSVVTVTFLYLFVCYQKQSAVAINHYCVVHWCRFLQRVMHSKTVTKMKMCYVVYCLFRSDAHNYLLSLSGSTTCLSVVRACFRKVRYRNVTIPSCLTRQICIERWWSWLVKQFKLYGVWSASSLNCTSGALGRE